MYQTDDLFHKHLSVLFMLSSPVISVSLVLYKHAMIWLVQGQGAAGFS